jgi:putative ABC transport system permease protein
MDKYAQYFRQIWNLFRQEKAFCTIYILGTGLSITIVMALLIVFYIKIANIYPETNRDRMLLIRRGVEFFDGGTSSGSVSYPFIKNYLKPLESAEAVAAVSGGIHEAGMKDYVQSESGRRQMTAKLLYTDEDFWTVFPFRFREGKPYTGTDVQSGIPVAVVARSLARRLFGDADAVGQYILVNLSRYRVCGVVEDASWITNNCYAQVWLPYSVDPLVADGWGRSGFLGNMQAYILAPSSSEVGKVKQEVKEAFHRFASQFGDVTPELMGQPDRYWQSVFRNGDRDINYFRILAGYGIIVLILLLVPAVSLSGMTDSRMERRLTEMGIRRAFGARTSTLMGQVLLENFLFTLSGGIVGLLFSWLLVIMSSSWIMGVRQTFADGSTTGFTPSMLINLPVFGIMLLVCFLLNLFSALIPAWRASRHQIVDSLNVK